MDTCIASADERIEKIDHLLRHIKADKLGGHNEEDLSPAYLARLNSKLEQIKQQLSSYPDQLINGLHQALLHGDELLTNELSLLISNGNHGSAAVHEHLKFRPHLSPDTDLSTVHSMIRGLRRYTQLPQMENYADAPADVQAQVIALLKVAEAVEASYVLNHNGNNLVELIMIRPSEADRIARIILDRQTMDTALIASILDSAAPSLSNGII